MTTSPFESILGTTQLSGPDQIFPADLAPDAESFAVQKSQIIQELEKQYIIDRIDASQPINAWIEDPDNPGEQRLRYDAMLVVQPSSLNPVELNHVMQAVESGVPTAIFEDPYPLILRQYVAGTGRPNPLSQEPQGDMRDLWDALHIRPISRKVVGRDQPYLIWQAYNPYPEVDEFNQQPEFIFTRNVMTNLKPEDISQGVSWSSFPQDPDNPEVTLPTANLEELVFIFSGAVRPAEGKSDLTFTPLVQPGFAGRITLEGLAAAQGGQTGARGTEDAYYTVAARIQGTPAADSESPSDAAATNATDTEAADGSPEATDSTETETQPKTPKRPMDVIYVSDIDCMLFLVGNRPQQGFVAFRMQNLVFILNLLDALTGETEYINIRGRVQTHRTLKTIEAKTDDQLRVVRQVARETNLELEKAINTERETLQEAVVEYRRQVRAMEDKKRRGEDIDELELSAKRDLLKQEEENINKRLETKQTQLIRKRDEVIREARRENDLVVQKTQDWYKWVAVLVPPIPLIVIGMGVFAYRRLREREGVSKNRLK